MGPVEELQLKLGYMFRDIQFLTKALTHSCHANERAVLAGDNEQLEFLGGSVLGFLVSDFLFRAHPGMNEGELSKLKGFFVSSANLVRCPERINWCEYLQRARSKDKT